MASARHFFLVAMLPLLLPQLCLSLLSPHYCRHHRPVAYKCRQPTQILAADPTKATDSDSPSSSPPIQQKRRRRKADSFFLTSSDHEIITPLKAEEKPPEEATKQSECPFAMTFPRYRVNISNNKNSNNDPESEKRRTRRVQRGIITKLVNNLGTTITKGDNNSNVKSKESGEGKNPWGVVSGIVQGVFKSTHKSTEAMYATEVKEGLFRWVSSAEGSPSLADEDFVAAAAFWRMVADIIVQQQQQQQNEKKWYLALPETTPSVASNLCDILNWYADLDKRESDDSNVASIQIIAQLDSRSDDVPVIQFTVSGNSQQQQQLHQHNTLLPSAADTERQTKSWVKRLLVELGVCPFTKSPEKSGHGLGDMGVPVANIMYRHSDALGRGSGGVYLLLAGEYYYCVDAKKRH